jgi:hypothetical protein
VIAAVAEAGFVHRLNHVESPAIFLRRPLGEVIKVRDLGADKEHRARILAGSHASPTSNAGCGVESVIRVLFGYWYCIGVRRCTSADRHETSSLYDTVKGAAIYNQVSHDRKCGSTKRLDPDGVSILKVPHMELTCCCAVLLTMRYAIDGQGAHSTNSLTAVMVEVDGHTSLDKDSLIHDVQHFEEGSLRRNISSRIFLDVTV